MTRETMEYDVVIVGAGPSGLAAAIRLSQLASQHQFPLRMCVIEKGAEVGAHLLSGAVLDLRALNELFPNWEAENAPLEIKVQLDQFRLLTERFAIPLPVPPQMKNDGHYIISLERLCQWMAKKATEMNVDIFPGFAAREVLYNEQGHITGIITNDLGIGKDGHKKPNYQPGINITARYTLFAEGARGSLTKMLSERFNLRKECDPQTYGLGVKEIWEIDPERAKKVYQPGKVLHTTGWPLDSKTYGGSFVYHLPQNRVALGFVVGLDYENPYLDIYEEFQRFKHHPFIRPLLEGGNRISYGARALNEGGLQAIPKLTMPGGLLIGCAAGFLNVPKIKGNHTAMKSGMIAAETVFNGIRDQTGPILDRYEENIRNSWIFEELKLARNIRPAFRGGIWAGLAYSALETFIFQNRVPWTFHIKKQDHQCLKKASHCKPIIYPKHDNILSFDKLTSVQLSNTHHEEDQPIHLVLKDPNVPIDYNLPLFDAPEQRYCPAAVYEIVRDEKNENPRLEIHASNCIHCKTCDIKDPTQNINWVPPEGGGGPHYSNM